MSIEVKQQAISGVSPGAEVLMESTYPSISSSGIGRWMGRICESIPLRIGGVALSVLLFGPLVAPFALLGYAVTKLTGNRYEVTNRSVRTRKLMGGALQRQVALADIADVRIAAQPGQSFYHAADIFLLDSKGSTLMVLPAVARPERLRQLILKTQAARLQADASLKTIQARV